MTSDELLSRTSSWTLACDNALLNRLKNFSENVSKQSQGILEDCDNLSTQIDLLNTKVQTVTNQFLMLSNTQFVENRVEEFQETLGPSRVIQNVHAKTKTEKEAELISKMKEAIRIGVVNKEQTPKTDEATGSSLFKLKLPHIIGTSKFFSSRYCGLVDESVPRQEEQPATISAIPPEVHPISEYAESKSFTEPSFNKPNTVNVNNKFNGDDLFFPSRELYRPPSLNQSFYKEGSPSSSSVDTFIHGHQPSKHPSTPDFNQKFNTKIPSVANSLFGDSDSDDDFFTPSSKVNIPPNNNLPVPSIDSDMFSSNNSNTSSFSDRKISSPSPSLLIPDTNYKKLQDESIQPTSIVTNAENIHISSNTQVSIEKKDSSTLQNHQNSPASALAKILTQSKKVTKLSKNSDSEDDLFTSSSKVNIPPNYNLPVPSIDSDIFSSNNSNTPSEQKVSSPSILIPDTNKLQDELIQPTSIVTNAENIHITSNAQVSIDKKDSTTLQNHQNSPASALAKILTQSKKVTKIENPTTGSLFKNSDSNDNFFTPSSKVNSQKQTTKILTQNQKAKSVFEDSDSEDDLFPSFKKPQSQSSKLPVVEDSDSESDLFKPNLKKSKIKLDEEKEGFSFDNTAIQNLLRNPSITKSTPKAHPVSDHAETTKSFSDSSSKKPQPQSSKLPVLEDSDSESDLFNPIRKKSKIKLDEEEEGFSINNTAIQNLPLSITKSTPEVHPVSESVEPKSFTEPSLNKPTTVTVNVINKFNGDNSSSSSVIHGHQPLTPVINPKIPTITNSLFGDSADSDDDLFTPSSKVKNPPKNKKNLTQNQKAKSVFDNSDSEDDLFTPSTLKKSQQPQSSKLPVLEDSESDLFKPNLKKSEIKLEEDEAGFLFDNTTFQNLLPSITKSRAKVTHQRRLPSRKPIQEEAAETLKENSFSDSGEILGSVPPTLDDEDEATHASTIESDPLFYGRDHKKVDLFGDTDDSD